MNQALCFYSLPLQELKQLFDSNDAERYSLSLENTPKEEVFLATAESLEAFCVELRERMAANELFVHWAEIRQLLDQFETEFGDFPNATLSKLRMHVVVAEVLTNTLSMVEDWDLTKPVVENQFEVRNVTGSIPATWFVFKNPRKLSDSLIVFACENWAELSRQITDSNISPELLFAFLEALNGWVLNQPMVGHFCLVKKRTPEPFSQTEVDGFVRLAMLSKGFPLHVPKEYNALPNVLNAEYFDIGESYQQWTDIHNVLSEYNSRTEILLKYLTIYHVVENLMLKQPIVELERQAGGALFSMRDFQRLYKAVEGGEQAKLGNLFSDVFEMMTFPGAGAKTFKKHIGNAWRRYELSVGGAEVIRIRGLLRASNGKFSSSLFTSLVYQIRCSIVHNKETELHLTYAVLDADTSLLKLIETFLLPSLEAICFSMIGHHNDKVWYGQRHIALYAS